ncbi:MAG: MotA/TolQ/ExbB proton channel family protein [Bdellovibrionota bacterium]
MKKLIALAGLALVLVIAFSHVTDGFHGFIDLRAALLVLFAPVLLLVLFQSESPEWGFLIQRVKELSKQDTRALSRTLDENVEKAVGQYGASFIHNLGESSSDSFVRHAATLYSSRFKDQELARLLAKRIETEDQDWQILLQTFSFLAKMAPYFGMLATVIGMVKLLENLSDFSKISSHMALAMQGTLYGLISFTLIYSPVQKWISGLRSRTYQRNSLIARWFVLVSQRSESAYIREEVRSSRISSERMVNAEAADRELAGGVS